MPTKPFLLGGNHRGPVPIDPAAKREGRDLHAEQMSELYRRMRGQRA